MGFFPSIKFAGNHYYPCVERGNVRVNCLAQEQNIMSPTKTRSSALAMRPARLLSNTTRQMLGTDGCLICYTTSVELSKTVQLKITEYKAWNSNQKKPEKNNCKALKTKTKDEDSILHNFSPSSGLIQHRWQINKRKAIKKSNFHETFRTHKRRSARGFQDHVTHTRGSRLHSHVKPIYFS